MSKLPICLALFGPLTAWAATPVISNPGVTREYGGKATLRADVSANGKETNVTFKYGTTTAYGSQVEQIIAANANGTVSAPVTNLTGGVTYHFQVIATNGDGSVQTADQKFVEPGIAGAVATNNGSGTATLSATVTTDGTAATLEFQYGLTTAYELGSAGTEAVAANAVELKISKDLTGLVRGTTYHFRGVLRDGANNVVATTADAVFVTSNLAPRAKSDSALLSDFRPVTIDVLRNDTDGDNDTLKLTAVTQPAQGAAKINGDKVVYTPSPDFTGVTTFQYTVRDDFGGTATGTVTIRSPRVAVEGTHSAVITDADGDVVGRLRLTAMANGSFTARIEIEGKTYHVVGVLDVNGRFLGFASAGDVMLPVLFTVTTGDVASIDATFGAGKWSASTDVANLTSERLFELEGRYTVELPTAAAAAPPDDGTDGNDGTGGTGDTPTTDPGQLGWMSIKLNEEGKARVKGKSGDGQGFSGDAFLNGTGEAPTLVIFARADDDALIGTLTLGDTVSGELEWRPEDGDVVAVTANGNRYVKPEKRQRSLEVGASGSDQMTFTTSGGDVPAITHQLRLSENDHVTVTDPTPDGLNLKIDRKSGIFKGKFRFGPGFEQRTSFSGVLLQQEGVGRGVFNGNKLPGRVELAAGGGSANPEPPTTPDPTEPDPTTPDPMIPDPADPL